LVGKPEGENCYEDPGIDERIILKLVLKRGWGELDLSDSDRDQL
jgi:hypothetical protein